MEICIGMVGMQPSEFWNSSVIEIHCAIQGFQEFHCAPTEEPMTSDGLQKLMELYPD